MERKALELEKSRGADDPVDEMSQAINRLRAMVSPQVFPANAAAADGRPRRDGVICWSRMRAVAGGAADGPTEPQQIPSAGTWIWSWISGARRRQWAAGARLQGEGGGPAGDPHRPGVVSLVAELRRPRAPGGRGTGAVERETRGPGRRGATDRDYGQVRSTGRSATE
jgi:hypothetical protein